MSIKTSSVTWSNNISFATKEKTESLVITALIYELVTTKLCQKDEYKRKTVQSPSRPIILRIDNRKQMTLD